MSYEPGPGVCILLSTRLLLSRVPSSLNFGLIEYFGPSPVNGVKSDGPEFIFFIFPLFIFSTGLLFVFDIVHDGYFVDTEFGSGLYLFGAGVNQGSSFCFWSIILLYINYVIFFLLKFFVYTFCIF